MEIHLQHTVLAERLKIFWKLLESQLPNKSTQRHKKLIFTSGGTEANNWILRSAVEDLKIKRIITSKIEHHAVLHTVLALQSDYQIQVDYVKLKSNGEVDINYLVELLSQDIPTLVSLMHVNNEIGTVLDLEKVGRLCKQYKALFHSYSSINWKNRN